MADEFEKKIDKHYTYKSGQDIGTDSSRNIGWYVVAEEHEPGKRPPLGQRSFDVKRRLSESSAKQLASELQAEEMKRRAEIEDKYPDLKSVADAAKREQAQRDLISLTDKRKELNKQLEGIESKISELQNYLDSTI